MVRLGGKKATLTCVQNVNETSSWALDLHYKVVSHVELYNFVVEVET